MSDSSIQEVTSLVGTKWLVTETKGRFSPFFITFNSGGKAPVVTKNGFFSGTFTWSGDFSDVDFEGSYNSQDGVYTCIGSPELGKGQYKITGPKTKQIGKFWMVQQ